MNILLVGDTHFTDNPLDEYRWRIFDILSNLVSKYNIAKIFCLGDVVDRKDRHTGLLVNRLVSNFTKLSDLVGTPITILSGNHDKPLTGPYYWEFLNSAGIHYVTKPEQWINTYLLPFSHNPVVEWQDIDFGSTKCILMHQTVAGVLVEGDRKLDKGQTLPCFLGIAVYSGDVHRPQTIGNIVYVGVPHPVKFGEVWDNRVLIVDTSNFVEYIEIPIVTIRRAILDISSSKELKKTTYGEGDQLKLRVKLEGNNLIQWPVEEEKIRTWAREKGIYLSSVEATISGDGVKTDPEKKDELDFMKPTQIVESFCKDEKLSDDIREMGIQLIRESL